MPSYTVKHPINKDRAYRPGEDIELTKEEAILVADALVNPPPPVAAKDKEVAKAIESQLNRPQPHNQPHQVDPDAIAHRRRAEAIGKTDKELMAEAAEEMESEDPPQKPAEKVWPAGNPERMDPGLKPDTGSRSVTEPSQKEAAAQKVVEAENKKK
jgi:hypothetical protein